MRRALVLLVLASAACSDPAAKLCKRYAEKQLACAAALGEATADEATCAEALRRSDGERMRSFEQYVSCFEAVDCGDGAKAREAYFACAPGKAQGQAHSSK